tara:strand:+ start:47 stop:208 length:162 start_codon:yes stop_codon:yes gene_type:complete
MKNTANKVKTTFRLISHKEAYEANRAVLKMQEDTKELRAILSEYYKQNPVKPS